MSRRKTKSLGTDVAVESKEAKFIRVVTPRIHKAVKCIGLVGNCASTGYSYTPEQIEQMKGALNVALQNLMARYESKSESKDTFNFTS